MNWGTVVHALGYVCGFTSARFFITVYYIYLFFYMLDTVLRLVGWLVDTQIKKKETKLFTIIRESRKPTSFCLKHDLICSSFISPLLQFYQQNKKQGPSFQLQIINHITVVGITHPDL